MSSIKLGGTLAGGASSPTAFQPPGLALAAPIAQAPVANQVVLNAGFDFVNGTITLLVQNQDGRRAPNRWRGGGSPSAIRIYRRGRNFSAHVWSRRTGSSGPRSSLERSGAILVARCGAPDPSRSTR
jgi:hypothetical protein